MLKDPVGNMTDKDFKTPLEKPLTEDQKSRLLLCCYKYLYWMNTFHFESSADKALREEQRYQARIRERRNLVLTVFIASFLGNLFSRIW